MNIKMKFLNNKAQEPTRGSEYAAGYDLYACEDALIPAHETRKIGTGLAFELPKDTFAAIFARSGLATKHGLRPANCVGVCDADYRGEIGVILYNASKEDFIIEPGERIAQMVIAKYEQISWEQVEVLDETERGDGGYGHTGVK